jgi:hypothetical protein
MSQSSEPPGNGPFSALRSPVVVIAMVILFSILVLILFAMLGWDRGVLKGMSEIAFARGLITYLFSVATIGAAVVLIVYALTNRTTDDHHFQHGKEILSLLMGVFGTIVGFYFGREGSTPTETPLTVAPLKVSTTAVAPGAVVHLITVAVGGKAPLRYGISFGKGTAELTESPAPDGWIDKDVTVPSGQAPGQVDLRITVQDDDHHAAQQSSTITVQSPASKK